MSDVLPCSSVGWKTFQKILLNNLQLHVYDELPRVLVMSNLELSICKFNFLNWPPAELTFSQSHWPSTYDWPQVNMALGQYD